MKQKRIVDTLYLVLFLFTAIIFESCKKEAATTSTVNLAANEQHAAQKSAAFVFSENFVVQIDDNVWLPCANGGNGEIVHLSGPLHVLITGTFTDNTGRVHYQFQSAGISGIGSVTGDKYIITSLSEETRNGSFTNGQFIVTAIENFRIIGPGKGNNYNGHGTFHFTYNANGEETASFDNFTADCK